MNFLTLTFLAFFSVLLLLYYFLPKKAQNPLLLAANCIFYCWAGPAMGIWLAGAVLLAFFCALAVERGSRRRLWLSLGALALLGALFVCRYLNFTARVSSAVPGLLSRSPSELLLPLGVSFYNLALAGYLFDVYEGKYRAERNFLRFAVFASFFPCVLCGPINRARELLPQLERPRRFELEGFKSGLWRFLCGAGKKLVPANLLAGIVDPVYAAPGEYGGGAWAVAVCAYTLYLYLDFSAYCDMAFGAARMLGLDLTENFRAPLLSRSVKEFWNRWQISLASWLREYLYFPLGGSRKGKLRTCLNILAVFAVCGIWHGLGPTFLLWGLLNSLYLVAGKCTLPARRKLRAALHIPEDAWYTAAFQVLFTFGLVTASFVLFRAGTVSDALFIFKRILLVFRDGLGDVSAALPASSLARAVLLESLALVAIGDWHLIRNTPFPIARTSFRFWIAVALLAFAILLYGQYGPDLMGLDFVYFHI